MYRLISVLGLAVMIGIAWLLSSHRSRVNWRIVFGGLGLQFLLAALILWTAPQAIFSTVDGFFFHFQGFVRDGAGFLFNINSRPQLETEQWRLVDAFAFNVLPTIIVFSSLMSILYYLGVVQWIVKGMAIVMQKMLHVSGAESLAAAANVFVGHTEAPLVVKPYIATMTRSELNALMVGGFATISGGLLAAYANMGISAGHLITASIISAPAALLIAKVMQPETETPETMGHVKIKVERQGVNVIEAAAIGATDGLKLAFNVAAMLIAFLALIAMANALIGGLGSLCGFRGEMAWSLEGGLGYLFAPLAWVMGVPWSECSRAGELLGVKIVANEFVAYSRLGVWLSAGENQLSPRTIVILTYALSGFSNFGAIGIQIGGIGGLAPARRSDLARLGLRAMIGGTLACCMTACVAGLMFVE